METWLWIIVAVLILAAAAYFWRKKCPSCNERGCDKTGSFVIRTERGQSLRTFTDRTKDRDGNVVSTTKRDVLVTVERQLVRTGWSCPKCHYEFSEQEWREVDQF